MGSQDVRLREVSALWDVCFRKVSLYSENWMSSQSTKVCYKLRLVFNIKNIFQ